MINERRMKEKKLKKHINVDADDDVVEDNNNNKIKKRIKKFLYNSSQTFSFH